MNDFKFKKMPLIDIIEGVIYICIFFLYNEQFFKNYINENENNHSLKTFLIIALITSFFIYFKRKRMLHRLNLKQASEAPLVNLLHDYVAQFWIFSMMMVPIIIFNVVSDFFKSTEQDNFLTNLNINLINEHSWNMTFLFYIFFTFIFFHNLKSSQSISSSNRYFNYALLGFSFIFFNIIFLGAKEVGYFIDYRYRLFCFSFSISILWFMFAWEKFSRRLKK